LPLGHCYVTLTSRIIDIHTLIEVSDVALLYVIDNVAPHQASVKHKRQYMNYRDHAGVPPGIVHGETPPVTNRKLP
jgi:hypothetical protein